jgi:hypothetical protein
MRVRNNIATVTFVARLGPGAGERMESVVSPRSGKKLHSARREKVISFIKS